MARRYARLGRARHDHSGAPGGHQQKTEYHRQQPQASLLLGHRQFVLTDYPHAKRQVKESIPGRGYDTEASLD